MGPYPISLLSQPLKQWGKGTHLLMAATRLTGLISPACNRYIQYLLTGANPSVLNRHRRGLQPWRCWLATYHSPTFPTNCLHLPLRAPPDLQFNQVPTTKPMCLVSRTYGYQDIYRSQHLCLAIANDLSLVIGVAWIDRKVVIMQLGSSSTPVT
jgi:hypothetical protein